MKPDRQIEGTALLILGMHRSGTSCLAGNLQAGGLELGNISTWNEHNRLGNRENRDFVNLNERVLKTNGGSWDNPPDTVTWNERQITRAKLLTHPFAELSLWGFKDPRLLLLLSDWDTILGKTMRIGIFRNPYAVAMSLHQRNKMPLDKALYLWGHYNSILVKSYKQKSFPILCFDWPKEVFHQTLNLHLASLSLKTLSIEESVFSPQLINQEWRMTDSLSTEHQRLHEELREISSAESVVR